MRLHQNLPDVNSLEPLWIGVPFTPLTVNLENVYRPPGMAQVIHNLGEGFVPMPLCVLRRPISILMKRGETFERHGKISVSLVVTNRIEGVNFAVISDHIVNALLKLSFAVRPYRVD